MIAPICRTQPALQVPSYSAELFCQQDTLLKVPHRLTAVFGSGSTFEQFGAGSEPVASSSRTRVERDDQY
jgi:hypothetical protein